MCNYQYISDFDQAFKNLLSSTNILDVLQYDLQKDLDSYLKYIKGASDYVNKDFFVEAALILQNIKLIYLKRVDQLIISMTKLTGTFRAYKINGLEDSNVVDESEKVKSNKKKKSKGKTVFLNFKPIGGKIVETIKNFDCKAINLKNIKTVPRIVLNSNIKVENKYSRLLSYISDENGENIGKKYDFMLNYPLDRDLIINRQFDCNSKEHKTCDSLLKCQNNNDQFPINSMAINGIEFDDILPSTTNQDLFDHTFREANAIQNAKVPNIIDVMQIPIINDDPCVIVSNNKNKYSKRPIVRKKLSKKKNKKAELRQWSGKFNKQLFFKFGFSIDPFLESLGRKARIQKRNMKKRKRKIGCDQELLDKRLKTGDEPGCLGLASPLHYGELDKNHFENDVNDLEEPLVVQEENVEINHNNTFIHDQSQQINADELSAMSYRVDLWHVKLRLLLDQETKRSQFDIHEYGTRILNCFQFTGERKSFNELVKDQSREEVARFFLSTLMMINTNNLKVFQSSSTEIIIELISKNRHHEELQLQIY